MNPPFVDDLRKKESRKRENEEHDGVFRKSHRLLVNIRRQNQLKSESRRCDLVLSAFPELRVVPVQMQYLPFCRKTIFFHLAGGRQESAIKAWRGQLELILTVLVSPTGIRLICSLPLRFRVKENLLGSLGLKGGISVLTPESATSAVLSPGLAS